MALGTGIIRPAGQAPDNPVATLAPPPRGGAEHDDALAARLAPWAGPAATPQPHPSSPMFDHVKFGVSDYAASKAFFLQALAPLGVTAGAEGEPAYGIELCGRNAASLCLFESRDTPAPLHIAFVARTRDEVDAFHRAALAAGGRDHGAPGLRPKYHANYYAAFVIGPDGHNLEAVCHGAA